ncbi:MULTISPECIES: hypothetical protein [Okeania]|uniref:hypothetical protein n=1 Tax=Okeania TaxID=1458928 RepID=UPI001374D496|nr:MULTISPECIES: hypothetical protein [Okeania]NET11516.1 hypothetical protein [Okeania sp. SIO1H6]NES74693.1 hypothetical protein [Okeania sp. SIO1H4]NES88210.1 hypothetical protein [Okeania sp. SIO2B9]NET18796.1 hypothetical protein [Okeania sp. SIO1H5]NET74869.1 hypothetical protein [Okeania sp. SIO1F9]
MFYSTNASEIGDRLNFERYAQGFYKSVTGEWIVTTFCERNYIEKFDREALGWLG